MRKVFRRFKDDGEKQSVTPIVSPGDSGRALPAGPLPVGSQSQSLGSQPLGSQSVGSQATAGLQRAGTEPGPSSQASASSVPGPSVASGSVPKTNGSKDTMFPSFQAPQVHFSGAPSRLTQGLAGLEKDPSIYSGYSNADNSLFSKNTRSTADSTIASTTASATKQRSMEERLRVMDSQTLAESHEKAKGMATIPVQRSRLEENPTLPVDSSVTRAHELFSTSPQLSPNTVPASMQLDATASSASIFGSVDSTLGPSISTSSSLNEEVEPVAPDATPAEALAALARSMSTLRAKTGPSNAPRVAGLFAQMIAEVSCRMDSDSGIDMTSSDLTTVVRIVLCFSDCLLQAQAVRSAKIHLLRSLYTLGTSLGLVQPSMGTVPMPRNWALGTDQSLYQGKVESLMTTLIDTPGLAVEQEGAYIAPVLRGLSPQFAVATICFGFPHPEETHFESLVELQSACPDIHIYGRKDYLRTCGGVAGPVGAPFRVPEDPEAPPISVSLATEASTSISGTLGGYLYPIIDDTDDELAEFRNATFAVTCGHVCLGESASVDDNTERQAMVPSPVLVSLFKKAILDEQHRYTPGSLEYEGYQKTLNSLDDNLCRRLGSVVWGERTVVNGMLSDLSIIKCTPGTTCRNFLGNDINISQYDPALMFSNLTVTEKIRKPSPGMSVFKYGSTSRYTAGQTSSSRLVYWSNGKLQSSEFVVTGESPVFATGGDSGAWILTKGSHGLGVLGMLHSYDGECKEFGLYTPIETVLDRLREITGVSWGLVGVPDPNDSFDEDSS